LLGSLPKQTESLPERHLGLVLPSELPSIETLLDNLAAQLSFDSTAWSALPIIDFAAASSEMDAPAASLAGRTIAVARDAAFAFIYPANIDTLAKLGARIVWFSPLADEPVPTDADAVYLPGGYPELHARQLAHATSWQASIRVAHEQGKPIVAECGGMMAIAESLTDVDGVTWQMASLLPGHVRMQNRLAGLGPQAMPTANGPLRGHTFHYSRLETNVAPVAHTSKRPSGGEGEAVYRLGSLHASYFHAYFPSNPEAVAALFSRSAA
jgi:cobyrinic acid a,c-diamide synthase